MENDLDSFEKKVKKEYSQNLVVFKKESIRKCPNSRTIAH